MLKTTQQPKKKTSAIQTKFSKKWAAIEKKQKRNQTLQKKITALYADFQSNILPEEHKMCESIAQETRHLITFLPRKSFTQWQREELTTWIESNIQTLGEHPFSPDGLAATLHQ